MRLRPLLDVLVFCLLALLLLQQLQWSGRRLLAEALAYPAVARLAWWQHWDIDPDEAAWQPQREALAGALRYMPDDPELLANLGDLYTQRLSVDALDARQVNEAVYLGSQAYLQSLRQRPTWVRDWDDLALIKYNEGLYTDADYQLALRQMVRFGSQRGDQVGLVIDLGIESWGELDDVTRSIIVQRTNFEQVRAQREADATAGVDLGQQLGY